MEFHVIQVKSAVRTPNRSMNSNPAVAGNLPKIGTPNLSPSAGQSKAKLGKLQHARTISNVKPDTQQTSLKMKPKSPALQEASKPVKKVVGASSGHAESSEVESKTPLKSGRESYLKAKEVRTEPHDVAIDEKDASCEDTSGSRDIFRDEVNAETRGSADKKDVKITPARGGQTTIDDVSANFNLQNITLSEGVAEDAIHSKQHKCMNDLQSLKNTDKNERAHLEDQVECLNKQVGAMDIAVGTQKMNIDNSRSSRLCDFDSEDSIDGAQLSSHSEPLGSENSISGLENMAGKRIPFAIKDSMFNR